MVVCTLPAMTVLNRRGTRGFKTLLRADGDITGICKAAVYMSGVYLVYANNKESKHKMSV